MVDLEQKVMLKEVMLKVDMLSELPIRMLSNIANSDHIRGSHSEEKHNENPYLVREVQAFHRMSGESVPD